MPRCILTIFALFATLGFLSAQDTLTYTRQQCEATFLKKNLLLLAEQLRIPKAEAALRQAKSWPNPTLTIDQINFWARPGQTGGNEVAPPFWNDFGRNQQVAIELQQRIQTAGKRRKQVAIQEIGVQQAIQQFEDVLRSLKKEFRNQITELQYTQLQQQTLATQLQSINRLTASYERQMNQGNISKNQFVRLKAQELEIRQDLVNWKMRNNELQSQLKTWMHLPSGATLIVHDGDFDNRYADATIVPIEELLATAAANRPDLQVAELEVAYQLQRIRYEKAQRIPDLQLLGSYDRNGSTMLNFVGFGVALDLPVFNRNEGNIRSTELRQQQAQLQLQNAGRAIENELIKSYQNYLAALNFRKEIDDNYIQVLDEMLEAYTRNFQQQNISILEYIDFLEAYLENRKSILEAAKSLRFSIEAVNYAVGVDMLSF